jgi:hypothetical protein
MKRIGHARVERTFGVPHLDISLPIRRNERVDLGHRPGTENRLESDVERRPDELTDHACFDWLDAVVGERMVDTAADPVDRVTERTVEVEQKQNIQGFFRWIPRTSGREIAPAIYPVS